MARECANCGAPYSGLYVYFFPEHPTKSRCKACSADLVNREHFKIWRRNFIGILVLAGTVAHFALSIYPALFILATITVVSYIVFPFMLPVNRF